MEELHWALKECKNRIAAKTDKISVKLLKYRRDSTIAVQITETSTDYRNFKNNDSDIVMYKVNSKEAKNC